MRILDYEERQAKPLTETWRDWMIVRRRTVIASDWNALYMYSQNRDQASWGGVVRGHDL